MEAMRKQNKKGVKKEKSNYITYNDEKLKDYKIKIDTYSNEDFSSLNLPKNKDLIPGQYEGGIKVWECSLDLCTFLPNYVGWYDLSNVSVLEIGCGHGLPGLYFLLRGAKVLFQDFNKEVLDKITNNYINQIKDNYDLELFDNAAFISGDWLDFINKLDNKDFDCNSFNTKEYISKNKFDIIISADTIYNPENYDSFYSIIKNKLNNPGICFVCSKKFYFGVGGGTSQFMDYIKNKGHFNIEVVKEINDGVSNIRQILEIRNQS